MSVINKTLKELNKRTSSSDHGVYVGQSKQSNKVSVIRLVLLVLLVCSCCVFVYILFIGLNNKVVEHKQDFVYENKVEDQSLVQVNKDSLTKRDDLTANQFQLENETKNAIQDKALQIENDVIEEVRENNTNLKKEALKEKNELVDFTHVVEDKSIEGDKELYQSDLNINDDRVYYEEEKNKKVFVKVTQKKVTTSDLVKDLYKKANTATVQGKKDRAITAYKEILQLRPKEIKAREKLVAIYFGSENYYEAIKLLESGLIVNPNHYDYRLYLARIYKSMGQSNQAIRILRKAEPPVKTNIDYYVTLASIARDSGDFRVSEYAYRKLYENDKKEGKWGLGLGISLEKQRNYIAALDVYKECQKAFLSSSSLEFIDKRIKFLEQLKHGKR
jgi:tetratricopeptide (TPR) repeat protein